MTLDCELATFSIQNQNFLLFGGKTYVYIYVVSLFSDFLLSYG
jgi:hypothetical protein